MAKFYVCWTNKQCKGRHHTKKRLKFGHCPNGGEGLGRMADVRTSLVGENGIAGRKKVFTGRKESLPGEKCIVLTITQFIQKINNKNPAKKFTY